VFTSQILAPIHPLLSLFFLVLPQSGNSVENQLAKRFDCQFLIALLPSRGCLSSLRLALANPFSRPFFSQTEGGSVASSSPFPPPSSSFTFQLRHVLLNPYPLFFPLSLPLVVKLNIFFPFWSLSDVFGTFFFSFVSFLFSRILPFSSFPQWPVWRMRKLVIFFSSSPRLLIPHRSIRAQSLVFFFSPTFDHV